jgi:hypothetical protein
MHGEVIGDWLKYKKKTGSEPQANKKENKTVLASNDDTPCALCGNIPCVWLGKLGNVIVNDQLEHAHSFGVQNRTHRSVTFHYIFWIINGGTVQKGHI